MRFDGQINQYSRLFANLDEFGPLLELDGRWRVKDADASSNEMAKSIEILRAEGAIEKVDRICENDRMRNVWTWDAEIKQTLLEFREQRRELPCGHRAHIHNTREVDGYTCKYCRKFGNTPEYDKQTVKSCL